LHLGESPRHTSVHIVTATEAGAWAQVTAVADQSRDLDIPVARLRATDTDEQRAEAYRAPVVVGTREDFTADLGKEEALGITRQAAMVEGKKAEVATLRAAYPKSFRT